MHRVDDRVAKCRENEGLVRLVQICVAGGKFSDAMAAVDQAAFSVSGSDAGPDRPRNSAFSFSRVVTHSNISLASAVNCCNSSRISAFDGSSALSAGAPSPAVASLASSALRRSTSACRALICSVCASFGAPSASPAPPPAAATSPPRPAFSMVFVSFWSNFRSALIRCLMTACCTVEVASSSATFYSCSFSHSRAMGPLGRFSLDFLASSTRWSASSRKVRISSF